MRYLLDTHVVLWWFSDVEKLSIQARDIITNRQNKIYMSSVSMWELAIKQDLGKLTIPINILSLLQAENIEILCLSAEDSLGITDLPKLHSDPFDRVLIAQAKLNNLIFITKDKKILQYPVVSVQA